MKKLIAIVLLTSALGMQAGLTTLLTRFPKRSVQIQRRSCQTGITKKEITFDDVENKARELEVKYGIGMRYFINSLKAKRSDVMLEYLQQVDAFASVRANEVPSQDAFDHWKKQQELAKE